MNVGFLGAPAVVPGPDGLTDAVEEAGPRRLRRARLPGGPRGAAITAGQQRPMLAVMACLPDGHVPCPASCEGQHGESPGVSVIVIRGERAIDPAEFRRRADARMALEAAERQGTE